MRLSLDDPALLEEIRSTMERQTGQLIMLVDDLLDVSRITQGKLELQRCSVTLSHVVQSAVEASRPFIDEAGHALSVSVPEQPIELEADPHRLAQVISNLLNNAAKYTSEGGRIHLAAERQAGEVLVSVRDTGVGIPAEMHDRIFEMLTQIDRTMERGYTGLGIGLTLVKSLVEMHGGRVEVESDGPGRGSTFRVRLPARVRRPAEEPGPVRPAGPLAATATRRRRVLVVDDNKAAADMLQTVVRLLGHDVRTAGDGRKAVEVAAEYRPEVVLMDLGMPRMNGYEAARHIRNQTWGAEVVLIALTGWGREEDRQRTREAGFDHHLVKPAEPAELQRLLSEPGP
jgi:CheY-like chemotaxis protein